MSDDSEFSDLTELDASSDEDEYVENSNSKAKAKSKATSSKKSAAGKKKGGWKIRNALKVPRATTYTAQALYDQIYGCDINLEPEYQRDVVWSEAKQIGIIDSVLRNFYIPPVIFAVNVQDDGSETKTCIDGKQRLTSIHKFMEGLIPHKDPITSEKLWYKDIPGPGHGKRKVLPEKYRRIFANKQIVCVEYQDITDGDEREIFQRVQLGMALTPAEKLQVIKTPRADFVRHLQFQFLKDDGPLGPSHLPWDTSRGSDFRAIAWSINQMDVYTPPKAGEKPKPATGLIGMPSLEKWLANSTPLSAEKKRAMENTYEIFAELVRNPLWASALQTPAKISPVEFIAISLFVYVYRERVGLGDVARGVREMREDVRGAHVDIRMNTRVSKSMFEFIRRWGAGGGKVKMEGGTGEVASVAVQGKGTKRKRKSSDEEEEEGEDTEMSETEEGEEEEEPKAKKAKSSKNSGTVKKEKEKAQVQAQPQEPPRILTTSGPRIKIAPLRSTGAPAPTISLRSPPPASAAAAAASTSNNNAMQGQSTSHAQTPPQPRSQAPPQPKDRMASLTQVKDRLAKERSERLPSAPRAYAHHNTLPFTHAQTQNPQMLPSPTIAQAGFRSASAGAYGGVGATTGAGGRVPLPARGHTQDGMGESTAASVARQANHNNNNNNNNAGPPPGSAGRDWDTRDRDMRDRERDYGRERDGRDGRGYGRMYDDRELSRRDSGSFNAPPGGKRR